MFFRWIAAIVLALLLGSLFSYFGFAAAWILAGILASATVAMTTHHDLPLHCLIDKSARGVIGVLAGIPMAAVTLDELTAVAFQVSSSRSSPSRWASALASSSRNGSQVSPAR